MSHLCISLDRPNPRSSSACDSRASEQLRFGIARALYHDADLIVFDEATSALDNLTEREVMSAVEALPGDKTILMIAHRLTTVKVCDRIVVMERGSVAGMGPWEELVEANAAFRALAQAA